MDHLPVNNVDEGVVAIVEYDYKAKEVDELDLIKGQIIHSINQQSGGWWKGTLSSSGKTGMFPDNFVRVMENSEASTVVLRDKSATTQRRCKAIYSYTQVNNDELSLSVGDIIEFLGEVEEGWWRGKLSNRIGVFPSNFVVVINTSPVLPAKGFGNLTEANVSGLASSASSTTQKQHTNTNSLTKSQNSSKEDVYTSSRLSTVADTSNDSFDSPSLPPRPLQEYCRVEFPYTPQNDDELELIVGDCIAIVSKDLPDKGWWKGKVNGRVGVFPDNFVKMVVFEELPTKDIRATRTDSITKSSKKMMNSNIPNINRLDSFGSRDSLDMIYNEAGIQSGNVAAQRKSLENKNLDVVTTSTYIDRTSKSLDTKTGETRKSLENLDEKKLPPPVPTKKPIVPGKKGSVVTNVAGNILSGLRQKVKNVEQKLTVSHDTNDGSSSSKYNLESIDNDKTTSSDRSLDSDNDFDKVQRASMLQDMRACRVKAPKRRPPSIAANLLTEKTTRDSIYVNGGDKSSEDQKSPPQSSIENDEQMKPKNRDWEKKTVPWMDELKASQVKKKNSPYIEPRTTIVDSTSKVVNIEEKSTNSQVVTSLTRTKNVVNTNASSVVSAKSPVPPLGALQQTNSPDKLLETNESDVPKSTSPSNIISENKLISGRKMSGPEEIDTKGQSKGVTAKVNVTRFQAKQSKSSISVSIDSGEGGEDFNITENLKSIELEKRVHSLEAKVQQQQKAIDDLQKMLKEESSRVQLLKNQLEKYAQCVTQV